MPKSKSFKFKNLEDFLSFPHDEVLDFHGFEIETEADMEGIDFNPEERVSKGILGHLEHMEMQEENAYCLAREAGKNTKAKEHLFMLDKIYRAKDQAHMKNFNSYIPEYRALGAEFIRRMERYEEILRVGQNKILEGKQEKPFEFFEEIKYMAAKIDDEIYEVEVVEYKDEHNSKYSQQWFKNGALHREDGEAVISVKNGQSIKTYYENGTQKQSLVDESHLIVSKAMVDQPIRYMGTKTEAELEQLRESDNKSNQQLYEDWGESISL